jgi:hypothetical protein
VNIVGNYDDDDGRAYGQQLSLCIKLINLLTGNTILT